MDAQHNLSPSTSWSFWLSLILVASYFVQIEVLSIGSRSLNLYHLVTMVFTVLLLATWLLAPQSLLTRPMALMSVFLVTLVPPAVLGWTFGLSNSLLVFAALSFALGVYFGRMTDRTRLRIYAISAVLFLLATAVRNVVHIGDLEVIYSRSRGCDGCFLATGGRNIEATMFAILAILYQGRYRLSFGLLMTLTVVLFQSRIGMIGASIFWMSHLTRYNLSSRLMISIFAVLIGFVAILILPTNGLFARFNISNEIALGRDGLGRIALWSSALHLIPQNPFGVGAGNAVSAINNGLNLSFWENNIHNVFLTWILELGWLHGIVLIAFVSQILLRSRKTIEFYAVLFLVLGSVVEFTGYDAVYWFFLGVVVSVGRVLRFQDSKPAAES